MRNAAMDMASYVDGVVLHQFIIGLFHLLCWEYFHGNLIWSWTLIHMSVGPGKRGDLHSFPCSIIHSFKPLLALDLMSSVPPCVATKRWKWKRPILNWLLDARLWLKEYLAFSSQSEAASHQLRLPLWFFVGKRGLKFKLLIWCRIAKSWGGMLARACNVLQLQENCGFVFWWHVIAPFYLQCPQQSYPMLPIIPNKIINAAKSMVNLPQIRTGTFNWRWKSSFDAPPEICCVEFISQLRHPAACWPRLVNNFSPEMKCYKGRQSSM